MIDIIKDSIVYDIGYASNNAGALSSAGRELARTTTHDFASFYAANESSALTNLAKFNESYGGFPKE